MVGLERDTQGKPATVAPVVATATKSTVTTGLEVAGLRERMDGMSMKLSEVDRRVGALEAVRHDDVDPTPPIASEAFEPVIEHSDVTASETSAGGAGRPGGGLQSHARASAEIGAVALNHANAPAPPVMLMLSDTQFLQWLRSGAPSPIGGAEQASEQGEQGGDWRRARSAARATRRSRR